jgi:beta-N-acetylhexosaminidase
MAGAESIGGFADRSNTAIHAGCDMIIVCNNIAGRNEVLDKLEYTDNPVSHLRLVRMHGKHNSSWDTLTSDPKWQQAKAIVEDYEPSPLLDMDIE